MERERRLIGHCHRKWKQRIREALFPAKLIAYFSEQITSERRRMKAKQKHRPGVRVSLGGGCVHNFIRESMGCLRVSIWKSLKIGEPSRGVCMGKDCIHTRASGLLTCECLVSGDWGLYTYKSIWVAYV